MATPNMGLSIPARVTDDGTWELKLDANRLIIDAHDHSSGNGAQVPSGGLNIDAAVDWNENDITGLNSTRFTSQDGSIGALTLGLAVKSDELHWINSNGDEVKITDGTTLNSALIGGITGDYAAANADVDYINANLRFRFWSDNTTSPETWAQIATEEHRLYPAGNGTFSVNLRANASLAANYNVEFPAGGHPSETEAMSVSAAGAIGFDGKHGERTKSYSHFDWRSEGAGTGRTIGTASTEESAASGNRLIMSLSGLDEGCRIKSVRASFLPELANGVVFTLYKVSQGARTSLGTATHVAGTNSWKQETVTPGAPYTMEADFAIHLVADSDGLLDDYGEVFVVYDR